MFFRFDEVDRAFGWMSEVHRQLERALGQVGAVDMPRAAGQGWLQVKETENEFWVRADLPGVAAETVDVTLDSDVLTLTAKRAVTAPEGWQPYLQERRDFEFTRSLKLPTAVDAERVKAHFEDGVLTLRIAKAAAGIRRQIKVT